LVVEQSNASGFASWIKLESERLCLWLLDLSFEHKGEWVSFEHGSLARCEQDACSARMYWVQRVPVGIDNKNE
jgi:hypothetical protein